MHQPRLLVTLQRELQLLIAMYPTRSSRQWQMQQHTACLVTQCGRAPHPAWSMKQQASSSRLCSTHVCSTANQTMHMHAQYTPMTIACLKGYQTVSWLSHSHETALKRVSSCIEACLIPVSDLVVSNLLGHVSKHVSKIAYSSLKTTWA